MSRKSLGIRSRRTADGVIELWLGEPGEAGSERIMCVSDFYLPGFSTRSRTSRKLLL